MTTDDLRKRAREAAVQYSSNGPRWHVGTMRDREERAFQEGALWHAAQQPSRPDIAEALNLDGWTCDDHEPAEFGECGECTMLQMRTAKRVLRLMDGEDND